MARTVRADEYNAKRDDILDAALRLIDSLGYERMTIRDLLDELGISRGAFYHYFETKQAVLEALVDRLGAQGVAALLPIVEDSELSAPEKLRRYFEASARVKGDNKGTILALSPAWYGDANALIRQRLTAGALRTTAPLVIEPIIRQGVAEGAFSVRYPAETAKVVMGLALALGDAIAEALLQPEPPSGGESALDALLFTCFEAVERILGAPEGSLAVLDARAFDGWVKKA